MKVIPWNYDELGQSVIPSPKVWAVKGFFVQFNFVKLIWLSLFRNSILMSGFFELSKFKMQEMSGS